MRMLARACATLGLAHVTPCLLGTAFERLQQVFAVLKERIPGQSRYRYATFFYILTVRSSIYIVILYHNVYLNRAGNLTVIQEHCSVALGLILQKLCQENIR